MENEEKTNNVSAENYIRNRIINSAIYLIIASVFFTFGYFIGNRLVQEPASITANAPSSTHNADTADDTWYEVKISNGRLCLYSVSNNETKELAGEEISAEMFPYDDMNELKNGLAFENFSNALACFEDFVS